MTIICVQRTLLDTQQAAAYSPLSPAPPWSLMNPCPASGYSFTSRVTPAVQSSLASSQVRLVSMSANAPPRRSRAPRWTSWRPLPRRDLLAFASRDYALVRRQAARSEEPEHAVAVLVPEEVDHLRVELLAAGGRDADRVHPVGHQVPVHHVPGGPLVAVEVELLQRAEQEVRDRLLERVVQFS